MAKENVQKFFAGLSGIVLPIPKYKFPIAYQSASRLTYYSTLFNSIEVNGSFYKVPLGRTLVRWAASVHDGFRFTFKLFKGITHENNLHYDAVDIVRFMEALAPMHLKRGCILIQFPPSLKNNHMHELDNLLSTIRSISTEWTIAVEFRDKGWYNSDVYDLLQAHNCTVVIQDIPASTSPLTTPLSDVVYIRFHGPTGNYRGRYTDDFLLEYSEYIKDWLVQGKTVYVYFNNTMGSAFENLVTLKKFVGG